MTRSFAEVEQLELLGDFVQPPERPAVVIFIMTLDEPQRQTVHQPGASVDRCELVSHGQGPFFPRIVRSSNAVIESAFVHSPTRPDVNRESRWSRRSAPSSHAWMWSPTATRRTVCQRPSA